MARYQNITGSQEKFCDNCEPYFYTSSDMDIVDILQRLMWPDSYVTHCGGNQILFTFHY